MVKQSHLLFLGDDYVSAAWNDTSLNATIYAIFRDLTDDGIENFIVSQVAGPWSKYDEETDSIVFDETYQGLKWEIDKQVENIKYSLNNDKDIVWNGEIIRA